MYRLKVFAQLLIAFLIVFVFVSFFSSAYIRNTYEEVGFYTIGTNSPKVEIVKSEATKINGHIFGKVTNNTEKKINKMYVTLDLFSKYQNKLGTEYIKVENLNVGEVREFTVNCYYEGINYVRVSTTNDDPEKTEFNFNMNGMDGLKTIAVFAGIWMVYKALPIGFILGIFPF